MCAHPFAPPVRTLRSVALGAVLVGKAALAEPDPRIAYLSRQLATATDPRVRAQAALTLGTTEAPGALEPLCGALQDPVPLVRQRSPARYRSFTTSRRWTASSRTPATPRPDSQARDPPGGHRAPQGQGACAHGRRLGRAGA